MQFEEGKDVEFHLINKINCVKYCVITLFSDGKILLNWSGISPYNGLPIGENGFFLSIRAAKKYVTENLSSGSSKWEKENESIN